MLNSIEELYQEHFLLTEEEWIKSLGFQPRTSASGQPNETYFKLEDKPDFGLCEITHYREGDKYHFHLRQLPQSAIVQTDPFFQLPETLPEDDINIDPELTPPS